MNKPELREFTCDVCGGVGETNNGTCFQCKGSGVIKEWVDESDEEDFCNADE